MMQCDRREIKRDRDEGIREKTKKERLSEREEREKPN
jgi:hypothetical protein